MSELSKSQALQIFRKGLPPLERYPMKTFKVTTRKARSLAPTAPNLRYELHRTSRCSRGQVYDATEPCPRSGNPLCHCTGDMGATIPAENIWADPRAEEVYDPQITPSITELTPVTDPRTGEAQLLHEKAWPPISPRHPATSPRLRMRQPDLPQSRRSASARSWRVWSSRSGRSWPRRWRRTASWWRSSRRRAIAISPLSSFLPSPWYRP